MREIKECTAEVFRRSEKRIKERTKKRNRILAACVPFCLILAVFSFVTFSGVLSFGGASGGAENPTASNGANLSGGANGGTSGGGAGNSSDQGGNSSFWEDTDVPQTLYFSLSWSGYSVGSYDSFTGELVKSARGDSDENVTVLHLTDALNFEICELLLDLHVEDYPNEYNPHGEGVSSDSFMTLILTVKNEEDVKTVRAENIAFLYESDNEKGQKFLNVCKYIQDVIISTEEWNSLPN